MSVKKGEARPEPWPSDELVKLDLQGLNRAWETVSKALTNAREVLGGKVRPEDSEFASSEQAKRILNAAELVRVAMDGMRLFLLDVMIEIVRERKKMGLDP